MEDLAAQYGCSSVVEATMELGAVESTLGIEQGEEIDFEFDFEIDFDFGFEVEGDDKRDLSYFAD